MADERALKILLYCKDYQETHPEENFGITCEMRSVENQLLAQGKVIGQIIGTVVQNPTVPAPVPTVQGGSGGEDLIGRSLGRAHDPHPQKGREQEQQTQGNIQF